MTVAPGVESALPCCGIVRGLSVSVSLSVLLLLPFDFLMENKSNS